MISARAKITATRLFCKKRVPMAGLTLLRESWANWLSGFDSARPSSRAVTWSVSTVSLPGREIFRVDSPVATFSPVCKVRLALPRASSAVCSTAARSGSPS